MAENITRCPKCYTSFRISDTHLNTEKGAVRCGSCLNIFNAKQNLIDAKENAIEDAAEPKTSIPTTKQQPSASTRDDLASTMRRERDDALKQEEKRLYEERKAKEKEEAKEKQRQEERENQDARKREKQEEERVRAEKEEKARVRAVKEEKARARAEIEEKAEKERVRAEKEEKERARAEKEEKARARAEKERARAEKEKRREREEKELKLALAKRKEAAKRPTAPREPAGKARPQQEKKTSGNQDSHDIPDDLLISDDMGDDAKKKTPYIESDTEKAFKESIFSNTGTSEYEFNLFERESNQNEDDEESQTDESWALDILENDDKNSLRSSPAGKPSAIEEDEDERHTTEEFEASYYKNSLETLETKPKQKQGRKHQHKGESQQTSTEAFDDHEDTDVDQYDDSDDAAPSLHATSSHHYLDAIEPEAVEFNWQKHSSIWDSTLLWGGGSLLAGILLVVQIAWIKFDTLSVIEPYRTYYMKACTIFSCTLPALIDRSKIRTTNLVIRSHPSEKNALIVDAVLQNVATFEQSFPILDLVFTNNQDKIIAARRLMPSDYLTGELTGRSKMPIKQPIHLAIEIIDPGSDAIGYKISIAD